MDKEPYKLKIKTYSKLNEETGCWEWQASKLPSGYGQTSVGQKRYRAHRLAYELWVGPIPEGMFLCHKCDNPCCVNPEHMFVGTAKDNMQDALKKGRLRSFIPDSARHCARRGKLSDEAVKVIRESDASVTCAELAKRFGVSYSAIWLCRRGLNKIYSEVPVSTIPKRRYIRAVPHKQKSILDQ